MNDLFRQKFGLTDNTDEKINTLINILKKENLLPKNAIEGIETYLNDEDRVSLGDIEKMLDKKSFTSFSDNAISKFIYNYYRDIFKSVWNIQSI